MKYKVKKLLGDNIQVRPIKDEKIGELYVIPGKELRYDKGEVLAVGPGRINTKGIRVPLNVQVGDIVLYQHLCPQIVTPLLDDTIILKAGEDGYVYSILEQA